MLLFVHSVHTKDGVCENNDFKTSSKSSGVGLVQIPATGSLASSIERAVVLPMLTNCEKTPEIITQSIARS